MRQLYGGRWPDDATTRKVYDEFLLQRAVQAYMLTLPALNVIGMRDGSEAAFGQRLQRAAGLEGPHGRADLGADAELRRGSIP